MIAEQINDDGTVFFRVFVKPLVNLIWLAGLVFVLGSLITLWPDAREERRLGDALRAAGRPAAGTPRELRARSRRGARRRVRRRGRAAVPARAGAADDALDELGRGRAATAGAAEERDRALAALKELEADHRAGRISDDDYREVVGADPPRGGRGARALDRLARAAGRGRARGREESTMGRERPRGAPRASRALAPPRRCTGAGRSRCRARRRVDTPDRRRCRAQADGRRAPGGVLTDELSAVDGRVRDLDGGVAAQRRGSTCSRAARVGAGRLGRSIARSADQTRAWPVRGRRTASRRRLERRVRELYAPTSPTRSLRPRDAAFADLSTTSTLGRIGRQDEQHRRAGQIARDASSGRAPPHASRAWRGGAARDDRRVGDDASSEASSTGWRRAATRSSPAGSEKRATLARHSRRPRVDARRDRRARGRRAPRSRRAIREAQQRAAHRLPATGARGQRRARVARERGR